MSVHKLDGDKEDSLLFVYCSGGTDRQTSSIFGYTNAESNIIDRLCSDDTSNLSKGIRFVKIVYKTIRKINSTKWITILYLIFRKHFNWVLALCLFFCEY